VALIAELIADSSYDDMTFGVVTLLGGGQAPLISGLLLDQLGPTLMEERAIRVGDPASFQGDERDVVILSMVIAHDPEGGRIGAMNSAAHARRINVAASRARNQMWVVHSVGPESLHREDPRRGLLEHCLVPEEVVSADVAFEKTESQFERDVLARILDAGYTQVVSQYLVGGYRIDLVVEGPEARLAVECDGDYWHGPDRWDDDRARQTVLERAGWTFERIRGSAFYRDRSGALEPLWGRLDRLGIPKGDWTGTGTATPVLQRQWPDDFDEPPNPPRRAGSPEISAPPPLFGMANEDVITGRLVSHPFVRAVAEQRSGEELSVGEIREWARNRGMTVGDRGRLHPNVIRAWNAEHPDRPV
jgi:very-short-patch-repair endonuclease